MLCNALRKHWFVSCPCWVQITVGWFEIDSITPVWGLVRNLNPLKGNFNWLLHIQGKKMLFWWANYSNEVHCLWWSLKCLISLSLTKASFLPWLWKLVHVHIVWQLESTSVLPPPSSRHIPHSPSTSNFSTRPFWMREVLFSQAAFFNLQGYNKCCWTLT